MRDTVGTDLFVCERGIYRCTVSWWHVNAKVGLLNALGRFARG
jgi:hypothetical protein